ncbi:hypothetical protein WR25_23514 [Diploscapter pachys]|uniref:FHF complex subunit HOOK-interacting protein C-terminal domain-containing protein n=1 Tax=Diploscapter pachys TaxID=2018661 RepID=A0A2A2KUJ4_9BILA|nr:hypothetical protein WR25_23514 [Diploscapter pachys]
MFRWLNRITSSPPAGEPRPAYPIGINEGIGQNWTSAFASEPSEWERTFDKCWAKVEVILERKLVDPEHNIAYDEMSHLLSQLSPMCQLLMMEVNAQPEPAIGPILDRFFTQQIMERVMDWAIQVSDTFKPICQLGLIRIYEAIVSDSHTQSHCLLVHKPILNPLLRLFEWAKRTECRRGKSQQPTSTEKHFVVLLNQLAEDRTLLHFFFSCSEGNDQFVVFTLLIPFLYEQNDVGQLARDALLLILSVSAQHEAIADFVANKSAFCPVVATGLSGCFSQLNRILVGDGNLRSVSEDSLPALVDFQSSLLFCNAVVQAAHKSVVDQICNYFYTGFLINVVKPALLQEEPEWVATYTAYLQMCIDTVTEPPLLKTILKMLLLEKDEVTNKPLIQIIVERVKQNDRLAVVSLALLDCLLHLGCEDVMLVLVFRHLLPMRHTSKKTLSKIRDASHVMAAAQKLLDCIPTCVLKFKEICSEETLELYRVEGQQLVRRKILQCEGWKWRYDGVSPSPSLFRGESDEEGNGMHTPFSRLSSCRSSMSSAAIRLNRYFDSRSSHLTAESNIGRLAGLGGSVEETEGASPGSESPIEGIEEDDEFVLPPINTTSIMTSSMIDYFQLATYDDLSESDESPRGSVGKEPGQSKKIDQKPNPAKRSESDDANSLTARGFDTDAEMARSFVLSGWEKVEDLPTFVSLLDMRTLPKGSVKSSTNELHAFIDSKLQYITENEGDAKTNAANGKMENGQMEEGQEGKYETLITTRGQPIDDGSDSCLFLDTILHQLECLPSHPLAYSLQLSHLVSTLASYPQPLLVAFLFDDSQPNDAFLRITKILAKLKTEIESAADSIEGFDVWVGRALRTLQGRAEKLERQYEHIRFDSPRSDDPTAFVRNRAGSGKRQEFRYHSHKAVESVESVRDEAAAKQLVYAAIVLATLCQQLAGLALHQSLVVLPQINHNHNDISVSRQPYSNR